MCNSLHLLDSSLLSGDESESSGDEGSGIGVKTHSEDDSEQWPGGIGHSVKWIC